jgi:hypothetical protein
LQVNGRRRKNFIQQLKTNNSTVHTHEEKGECIFQHFCSQFGRPAARQYTLDWETFNLEQHNLEHLEQPFSEEEILAVVRDLAADKAPGPGILVHS